jgi:hypothetical protein
MDMTQPLKRINTLLVLCLKTINITFAGNFQLPASTSMAEIKALVYDTTEFLGLIYVANTIVGDVSRNFHLIR